MSAGSRLAFEPIGVVVGLAAEACIALRLGWPVAIGGATSAGAEHAAQRLMDAGFAALVSFGLAGGLDPSLRPGALVVPAAVIARGERYATDRDLSQRLGEATEQVMLGADTVVASAVEKRRLHNETHAVAMDMESGAVARVAAAHGKPFAVLRAICDPVDRDLPPAALLTLDEGGVIGIGRLLASVAVRPGQVPALLRLAAHAAAARRALEARVRLIAGSSVAENFRL
jgi:adenosylhomocysteine nucleosidase